MNAPSNCVMNSLHLTRHALFCLVAVLSELISLAHINLSRDDELHLQVRRISIVC